MIDFSICQKLVLLLWTKRL